MNTMYWIHIIANVRYSVPKATRLTLYNTLIKPHVEYCVKVQGTTFKKYKKKLVIAQKKLYNFELKTFQMSYENPV